MNYEDLEIRMWPSSSGTTRAVIALHVPTGVAVVVGSEQSRQRNQDLAVERVQLLLAESNSPGGWIR